MEENMAIELNDFVEKVLRDLAGFVPVGERVEFEVSPAYVASFLKSDGKTLYGEEATHAYLGENSNGDKLIFSVPQKYEKTIKQPLG